MNHCSIKLSLVLLMLLLFLVLRIWWKKHKKRSYCDVKIMRQQWLFSLQVIALCNGWVDLLVVSKAGTNVTHPWVGRDPEPEFGCHVLTPGLLLYVFCSDGCSGTCQKWCISGPCTGCTLTLWLAETGRPWMWNGQSHWCCWVRYCRCSPFHI